MKEKNCKYKLPCGWCDRKNEMCIYEQETIANSQSILTNNETLKERYGLWDSDSNDPCEHCPNNPKNGGSGVCNCIVGLPKVIY